MRVVIVGGVAGGMSTATRLRRLDADAEHHRPRTVRPRLVRQLRLALLRRGADRRGGGPHAPDAGAAVRPLPARCAGQRRGRRDRPRRAHRHRHVRRSRVRRRSSATTSSCSAWARRRCARRSRATTGCRTLRTVEDAARLASDVDVAPSTAVVIGAGFIGLEMAENLVGQGIDVTIVEATPQVLPPLDPELAILVADELVAHGVHVETGATVASVEDSTRDPRRRAGPSPRTSSSARSGCGRTCGSPKPPVWSSDRAVASRSTRRTRRTIPTSTQSAMRWRRPTPSRMRRRSSPSRTSPTARVEGWPTTSPGDPRTRSHPSGRRSSRCSIWSRQPSGGTNGVCAAAGRPFRAIHSHPFDHATYYPGATRMAAKLIFDPDDGTILGAQIVGRNGVDKRIDVIATAMAGGITADRLADLELAYAPPFSSAKDPVNLLGYMAENVLSGDCDVVDPHRARRSRRTGMDPRRRAHGGGARRRRDPRIDQRADRLAPRPARRARRRDPSSSTARSVNEDTPRPH